MSLETYLAFCLASLALAVVPGPTVTVILANSLRFGSRAGLLNVAGTQVGVAIWLVIAALGMGAAVHAMGVWFDALRWAGAAYLVWLGIKLLRSNGNFAVPEAALRVDRNFFLQGLMVIMSNPKMLVLFGAIIPPFLSQGGDAVRETLVLGFSFAAIAALTDSLYALLAGRAGAWLSRSRIRAVEVISGLCLAVGGVWMALKGRAA